MRVGEVAALRIADVVDEQHTVKAEIVLAAAVTKSKRARRIFVPKNHAVAVEAIFIRTLPD